MNSKKRKFKGSRSAPSANSSTGRTVTAMTSGAVLLLAILWLSHDLLQDERTILFRYLAMGFAGVMAFITPHMLFPDAEKTFLLQLNPPPKKLFLRHLKKMRSLWIFGTMALFLAAFGDPSGLLDSLSWKMRLFATGFSALSAIILYALYRFVTIGEKSQNWNEGKTGRRLFVSLDAIGKSVPVDAGMFPTFMSTIMVTFTGMMTVVVSAAIPGQNAVFLPFFLLFCYSGYRLWSVLSQYDRLFYQSDAFYDELFTNPVTGTNEDREPARYDAVYWVPSRWRAAVWTQMVQFDRKRPMGRLIALLSFTYWLLIWFETPGSWHAGWLFFWILSKNMLAWPVSGPSISPPVFHWWMMPPSDWVAVRFFLQTRWTLALALTVAVAAFFSESANWPMVWHWVLVDMLVSALTAWLFTINNEFAFKKKYA